MLTTLLAALAIGAPLHAAPPLPPPPLPPPAAAVTDTTFPVRPNGRLEFEGATGTIRVRSWNRSEMQVRTPASAERVSIRHDAGVVRVRGMGGGRSGGALEIMVPAGFSITLSGNALVVDVEGVDGRVVVKTVNGAITVRGGAGSVEAETLNASIIVENVRGAVQARTTNDGITIRGVGGAVAAETVNGLIRILDARSGRVQASSVNGRIEFRGAVHEGGSYRFQTHNGEVVAAISPDASATVTVHTLHGEFRAGYPVTLLGGGSSARRTFRLGGGSASVELTSFNGNLRLIRP